MSAGSCRFKRPPRHGDTKSKCLLKLLPLLELQTLPTALPTGCPL